MGEELTIGKIPYANCTPIFHFLKKLSHSRSWRYIEGVPSYLNELLLIGDVDVSPSSSIEYARNAENYILLPDLSISSFREVKSVLLFSKRDLSKLSGSKIFITASSATSYVLTRIILEEFIGIKPIYEKGILPAESAINRYDASMIIGDEALRCSLKHRDDCIIYDLGSLWRKFTGLPAVFALWIVNKKSWQVKKLSIRTLWKILLHAKILSYERVSEVLDASEERKWFPEEMLIEYWKGISYDLGVENLKGLMEFYKLAAKIKDIKSIPELTFI